MTLGRFSFLGVLAAFVMSGGGCATIVSDDEYPVSFTSAPSGALVTITNEDELPVHRAETPFTTVLDAGENYYDCIDYTADFSLPGYERGTMLVNGNFDEWVIGNIIFGGLIGILIVDPLTGSGCELPQRIHVVLSPLSDEAESAQEEPQSMDEVPPQTGATPWKDE